MQSHREWHIISGIYSVSGILWRMTIVAGNNGRVNEEIFHTSPICVLKNKIIIINIHSSNE